MAIRILLADIEWNGGADTLFVASQGFTTKSTDTPASRYYDGRIKDNGPSYTREVQLFVWGGGSPAKAIGDFDLINDDGELDYLLDESMRDGTVTFRLIDQGADFSTSVVAAVCVIDTVRVSDEQTLRVVVRDKSALLDRPLGNSFYPSSAPNTELEGELQPIVLGNIEYVPIIPYDPANLTYAVIDDTFRDVQELLDRGVVLTLDTGWRYYISTAIEGVVRITNPDGKQCAKVRGQINTGATDLLSGIGFFTTWSGDNPSGWTVTESIARVVTQSAGKCRFLKSVSGTCRIEKTGILTVSNLYYYAITVTNFTSGTVTLADSAGTTIRTLSAAGIYTGTFTAGATGIRVDAPGSTCDITVDNLVIVDAEQIEYLPEWIEEICEARGPLDTAEIDYAGTIADVHAATEYPLAYYSSDTVTIRDLLQQTLDSFSGGYWFDRLGVLKVGVLDTPKADPVLDLTDVELIGDIIVTDDEAPGLADRMSGLTNYAVHEEGEIAGSVLLTSTATKLKRQNVKRKGSTTLADEYAHAVGAEPIPTLHSSGNNLKAEIDRLTALYASKRRIVTFTANVSETDALEVEPFDVVSIQTDRFGMDGSVEVVVKSAKSDLLGDAVTIEGWY